MANALLGGLPGLVVSGVLYFIMALMAYTYLPAEILEGSAGICFPSPNQWQIPSILSFISVLVLTSVCVMLSLGLNTRFSNLIPGTGVLYATMFLIGQGAVPWSNSGLSSSLILLTVSLICIHILFSLYGQKNASKGIFIIFSTLAWGAMIQYAFILLIPIFLLGAMFLSVLRIRETGAAILGILTPFWIITGFDIITIQDIELPTLTNLFYTFTTPGSLFYMLITLGFSSLVMMLLTVSNAMSPSAGQQQRSYLAFINLLGISTVWYMVFDSSNILAYSSLLMFSLGFQTARYAALPRHKFAYLPVVITVPILVTLFFLTIYSQQ